MKKQGLGIMKQKFMDYHIQLLYMESKLPSPENSERKTVVMYVCICVCVHVCMRACVYARMSTK